MIGCVRSEADATAVHHHTASEHAEGAPAPCVFVTQAAAAPLSLPVKATNSASRVAEVQPVAAVSDAHAADSACDALEPVRA